jgi:hypothetical protein
MLLLRRLLYTDTNYLPQLENSWCSCWAKYALAGYRGPSYPAFDVQPSIGLKLNALPRRHCTDVQEGTDLRDVTGGLVTASADSTPRPRFVGL